MDKRFEEVIVKLESQSTNAIKTNEKLEKVFQKVKNAQEDTDEKLAEINNVNNQISVMGKVDNKNFFSSLPNNLDLSQTIILCDIEGEEFNFFSEHILKKLKKSNLIIEIHNENSTSKEITLLKIAKKFFDVSIIIDSNKDMSEFNMLHNLNDIDRNLIACEGRSYIGKWWHLSPK